MLGKTLIGKELYLRVMGTAMRSLVADHREELAEHTNLDLETVGKVTYLYEFDTEVQCALWGYPTVSAYYRDASSTDAVLNIKIPFIALQATDDPIAVKEGLPWDEMQQNPNTVMITSSLGGHLCWFQTGGTRWHTGPICNFLNYMAFETDLESVQPEKQANGHAKDARVYSPMSRRMHYVGTGN